MRIQWARTALAGLIGLTAMSCGDSLTTPKLGRPGPGKSSNAQAPGAPRVVISQVYGGGGNTGATLQNDFVELFNAGTADATLDGWSVQYASATGTGAFGASASQLVTISGTLVPGQYYLIKMSGGAAGAPLPTADATNTGVNMSASAGKVALVDQATSLACNGAGTNTCSATQLSHIIDLVGFGTGASGANFYEGTGPAPTISATTADYRVANGCTDTNDNKADFAIQGTAAAPSPRNKSTTLAPCAGGGPTIGAYDHVAVTGPTTVAVGSTITLTATLQDASNQTITDAAATYDWSSATPGVAQVLSTSGNTATIKGLTAGGPVTISVTATSSGTPHTGTSQVSVTGGGTIVPSTTRVSEIHYDNFDVDANEKIEIEGDANSSIDGWSLELYDGNGGALYSTKTLTGTIPATCGARGVVVVAYDVNGIQNGPDGWALVNAQGQVVEFNSYEGSFTATSGHAAGLTSTKIGADESTPPPAGMSVQLAKNGVWFGPTNSTFGVCNPDVPPPHGSLSITSGKTSLAFAMQTQFFYSGTTANGSPVTSVTWTTSNSSIITVDSKGVVTAKGLGIAQLIATANDGTTAAVDMTTYLAAGPTTPIRLGHNTEFGEPKDANPSDDFLIRRDQYTVDYNPNRGGANWVSWNLDASHTVAGVGRCSGTCYSADTALVKAGLPAYTTADWVSNSTYDRGHMAPSADWTSSEADNNTTFFLTNFLPQNPDINQGPWEVLETALRDSVADGTREAYIIAGGIFTNGVGLGTLLNLGKIGIPDSTWKIAVITPAGTGRNPDGTLPAGSTVLAVNMPNQAGLPNIRNSDWHSYLTTVAKIERSTGYNFLDLLNEATQCRVEVRNCAPVPHVVTASGATTVAAGTLITINTSASDADGADGPWKLAIDFGDGTTYAGTLLTLPTDARPYARGKTFATPGVYTVRVTVTDKKGGQGVSTLTITVTP